MEGRKLNMKLKKLTSLCVLFTGIANASQDCKYPNEFIDYYSNDSSFELEFIYDEDTSCESSVEYAEGDDPDDEENYHAPSSYEPVRMFLFDEELNGKWRAE